MFVSDPFWIPLANAFLGRELPRVQRRHHVRPVPPSAAELAVHSRADVEPRRRHDDRIDERPLDAVVGGRLVPLVDDADRHEQHARAHVEAAGQQEVHVRLLELELSRFLEPFDERVLELQLADEADAVAEAVRDEQHEAMKVEAPVLELALVEVEVHVARDGRGPLGRWWRLRAPGPPPSAAPVSARAAASATVHFVMASECSKYYISLRPLVNASLILF